MAVINENFLKLKDNYLFIEIANRVSAFKAANPGARVISLGIGDVTMPLAPTVIRAMRSAVEEMGSAETFRGYSPDRGYDFLREAIRGYYAARGVRLELDDIFVSDGAKSDTGNIGDIFGTGNTVLIPDPVYPVYVDASLMGGKNVAYAQCGPDGGFVPEPPDFHADIIYLCSPNNPTGAVMTREQLRAWVEYALKNEAVILFDAAYEAFISDPELPHSIYEIDGASECAIEFCSFSKTAGFTGTRCAYTVVPKGLSARAADGSKVSLNRLWARRQGTKFNGVPYVVQRGAEAALSPEGLSEIRKTIAFYMENAQIIRHALDSMGIRYFGGRNAPYIWLECPGGLGSWQFFDRLLSQAHVVGTPGAGFGKNGEGYFRLTAFGSRANTVEAVERLRAVIGA